MCISLMAKVTKATKAGRLPVGFPADIRPETLKPLVIAGAALAAVIIRSLGTGCENTASPPPWYAILV